MVFFVLQVLHLIHHGFDEVNTVARFWMRLEIRQRNMVKIEPRSRVSHLYHQSILEDLENDDNLCRWGRIRRMHHGIAAGFADSQFHGIHEILLDIFSLYRLADQSGDPRNQAQIIQIVRELQDYLARFHGVHPTDTFRWVIPFMLPSING